ncbi:hypothetical protein HMPREF3038_02035 [Akkermansia sp. KLE1797]|jgi:hypothetical protein|nr:hypothetical protein HMPREF3038_02035 [Akkermansia sp. KLE1797]KXU53631.1 hypothetical protein HMPREF3039_02354 [Akkermansia sp. KLE1798]KZA05667.1 hypothetical protein HMPREF1326_00655 [Akkermansia sp. KLE1605]
MEKTASRERRTISMFPRELPDLSIITASGRAGASFPAAELMK